MPITINRLRILSPPICLRRLYPSTTREGVFAGGDAVMGARTVVEAVAIAKKVAESMDAYMKSLPADNTPDPYADIPVFSTPTSDVLAKQGI